MLIELDERQVNILLTITSFVSANGKQVPLQTITGTLNAMAGLAKDEGGPITQEALQTFGQIFGELAINNVNVPIRDIIAITNALQTDKSGENTTEDKIPDMVKQVVKENTTEAK